MKPARRPRGLGSVYKRGRVWWICLNGGKPESSGFTRKRDAESLLEQRIREAGQGRSLGMRTMFEDLAEMLAAHYRAAELKSFHAMLGRVKRLREVFGKDRATDITFDRLTAYVGSRREAGASSALIRYELALLKQMFRLARKAGRVAVVPEFPTIEVHNARRGFFEHEEFVRVVNALPEHLRAPAWFAYLTGWRKSEVLGLTWRQVDFEAQVVRLEAGTTKNGDGRTFPFRTFPQLAELLREQRGKTSALEREQDRIIPTVFHRAGEPVGSFRKAWAKACREAGVPWMLFHDLRRTAVRNLERAGVARSRAMKLTGHRTEAVYRRYAIVSEADLAEGVEKLAAFHDRLPASATVGLQSGQKAAESVG